MEKKDITTNELAVMVKRGFDDVLDNMNKGFKRVDERFEQVDGRFGQVESRLDVLEQNQKVILTRLEDVICRPEFNQLKERVKIIEEALALKGS